MKNLILSALLLCSAWSFAQPGGQKMRKASPEIQAKKMTLALDLSEKQESEVLKLLTEQRSEMESNRPSREEMKKMSQEERKNLKIAALDQKIEMKRDMKNILNADQYQRWEKMMAKKAKNRMERLRKLRSR